MEHPYGQGKGDGGAQNFGVDANLGREHRAGRLTLDTPIPPDGNPGVDDLESAVLAKITGLRRLDDSTDPPHAMFAVGVQLDGPTDWCGCHSASWTPLRSDLVGRRRHCRVVPDPMLAPDLGSDYVCLARLCDAVSSTTGSRLVWTLWGFPSPVS